MAPPSDAEIEAFRALIWEHHRLHRRDLPWRRTRDPYAILVSEIMLQQTQVSRVIPKFEGFLRAFPTIHALARAGARDVLATWQGLGYNRRGLALHSAAHEIVAQHHGAVPSTQPELRALPGVGPSTAGAVAAFAFDIAVPFVETNIRSTFIHVFFSDADRVSDAAILALVEATLDRRDPREWYYALMDYGSCLKAIMPDPARRSSRYRAQSPFVGSRRQLRAAALRALLASASAALTEAEILRKLTTAGLDPTGLDGVLADLVAEGFLALSGESYRVV